MKKILKILTALFIFSLSVPVLADSETTGNSVKEGFRGLWVATVDNIDYPSEPTTDVEILKSEAIKILDDAQNAGFNAIFLQVRPAVDSIYKSEYFPWSKYLTGSQGLMPGDDFDPLEFWTTEAHRRGIELHAWINPYRVTKKIPGEPEYDTASLDPANPARVHPDWVVKYPDGNLYFDPGIPEVRQLIINGVLEIIKNYNVDGIHFDDYFYPGKNFNDKATYKKYGAGYGNVDDWRRANTNTLIGDLSKAIRAAGRNVRFGVSPFGIWANKDKNTLGSDTHGWQSYYEQYADTRKWVKEGMVDYIAPQLYWNIGYAIADYSKLLSWWKDTVSGTGVDLYIGQAAYLAGNSNPSSPWYGISEIEKQLKLNATIPDVKGSIFFSYKSLADKPALLAMIKAVYEQRDGMAANIPVNCSRPSENIKTAFSQFYLNGSSDPGKPLFLNGKPVENRSSQGYFGILVPLAEGENIFTFSQEASYTTRVIYREAASPEPEKMSTAQIPTSSVFPRSQEYRMAGEKITLSCQAPIGSKVTVKLNGKNFAMKPSVTASSSPEIYLTTFTYVYTIPSFKGTPRNIDLGAPVYAMNYKGIVKTCKAPGKVGVIMDNSPFYARVSKTVIDTYNAPVSGNGAAYELYNGMVDSITGMIGDYIRLSSGQWVKKSSVTVYTSRSLLSPAIKNAVYEAGEKWDSLKIDISSPAAAIASFDGTSLKLNISPVFSPAVLPVLPENSLFSSAEASESGNKIQYILTLKKDQRIEGYYIENTASGITLNIKRRVRAKDGDKPLAGITIMLDPGHGGSEAGAIGPLGMRYPEKVINLKTALKLRTELKKLGAEVLMTRTTDKGVTLEERLAMSRNAKPDMFLSLHSNSMEDNVDISKIEGFSTYYREALAQPLAKAVLDDVTGTLNRKNKGIHNKNFYVMRGTWTPSILIETGFVPNPNEFEWLTDRDGQTLLAKSIAEAILRYFAS